MTQSIFFILLKWWKFKCFYTSILFGCISSPSGSDLLVLSFRTSELVLDFVIGLVFDSSTFFFL